MMQEKSTEPNQVQGIGTDIIEIHRIKEAFERHGERFLKRIFTEKEKNYCQQYKEPIPHFAGRFAAKEAVLKAFGTGLHPEITWNEIEIINNSQGKPEVHLSERVRRNLPFAQIFISISHCDSYATATAIVVG